MKVNWKLALMCFATLAMVACGDKNPAVPGGGGGGGGGIPEGYEPPIDVEDESLDDWDLLDPTKVQSFELTAQHPYWDGLKKIQVYADSICIFYAI